MEYNQNVLVSSSQTESVHQWSQKTLTPRARLKLLVMESLFLHFFRERLI